MQPRILLVDPERSLFELCANALREGGHHVIWRANPNEALDAIDDEDADALIADFEVLGRSALEMVEEVTAGRPTVRVLLLGPAGDFDRLLAAVRAGAGDYLPHPVDAASVAAALARALRKLHRLERPSRSEGESAGFEELLGASPPMKRLYQSLERAADTSASILITGESGTGKELVARALHRHSRRRSGPFVAINCSALPEPLLESELFGHVKGAFTDAKIARSGLFVKAGGGTVFLDEIGDMPLSLQPKLLRALQERRVRPVGGDQEVPIDVRLIVATNRDLEELVHAKHFREDLFYRINVIHIGVPPLRERATDIPLLARHYIGHFSHQTDKPVSGLSPSAIEKLLAYSWPGNVRELQNCIERAVAMTRHQEIQVADLPDKVRYYRRSHVLVVSNEPSELVPLEEVERRYILRVLESVKGNKKEAARILAVDRKTLYRKLDRWGQ